MKTIDISPLHKTFITDECDHCPICGFVLNAMSTTDMDSSQPESGDVSICFNCTSYLIFDENFKVRLLTVDEIVDLPNEMLVLLTGERNKIQKFKN